MKRMCCLFVLVATLAAVGPGTLAAHMLPQAPPQDSVALVLARYAVASGGDALAEISSEVRRGILVRGLGGPVPCEVFSQQSRKWWWGQTLAWGDPLAYGFDGDSGWIQDGREVGPMSTRQSLDFQLLFDITSPLRMRELFPEMTLVESEKNGDTTFVVLLARSTNGLTTNLAFDRETGLLRRVGEVFLEDYRTVGTVTRPFRMRIGEMLRVQFTEILHDIDVDETLFTRPTTALVARDPVLYRRHEQIEVTSDALDACVGQYQLSSGPVIGVTRQGSHLMLQVPNSMELEIFPMSETSYFMRFNHLEVHFLRDESGSVAHLALGVDSSRTATKIR